MHRVMFRLLVCGFLVSSTSIGYGDDSAAASPSDSEDPVFGVTRVWKIHLHVSAENWKAMQPTRGGMPGFGPAPPGGPPANPAASGSRPKPDAERKPDNPADSTPGAPPGRPAAGASPPGIGGAPGAPPGPPGGFRPGSFGYEFEYVKADIELDGNVIHEVGLRFKGNGTYMLSASTRKRPFKVDFNRYVEDQRFHGLQQLNLHNNVMDPTHLRQALSYPVFQAANVPSPRTAYAEVTLTIDGECDRERLGLYTLVEEVDKAFLKRHFQTTKGMLLKPEGTQGLEYKGDDWTAYAWYEPKSKPKKSEARRLIDALRLIHQGDDTAFRKEIGDYLDIDEFARFLAANTLLSNMDSFLTHVHNYYLYLPPESKRFVVLPWDMDLSMGAFFMAGSAEQLQELSIRHPHMGDNKLLDRLLAWDDFDRLYRDHLRELTETCFGEKGLTTTSIPVIRAAIKEQVQKDEAQAAAAQANRGPGGPGGFGGPAGMFGSGPPLETFIAKRRESITAQLAGTSKGRQPSMGFGPGAGGPRPGGPPGGFGPGNFHGEQILRMADTNQDQKVSRDEFMGLGKSWLVAWDKDKNESLSNDEITAGLNVSLGPPPNAAPGGFKPPAGFGPGMFLGSPLLKMADADMDGNVSRDEWNRQFSRWFKEWETSDDMTLNNAEVTSGLNKAFAPPPGFGPPGFGPPGGGPGPKGNPPDPKQKPEPK